MFWSLIVVVSELEIRYGFSDRPDVAEDLSNLTMGGVDSDPEHTTYFLGSERIGFVEGAGMAPWRDHHFAYLSRNAGDVSQRFRLPPDRCVDIGVHVDI